MKYLLSLGSNIGNSQENICTALQRLEEGSVTVIQSSSFYLSSPVDYLEQDDFINIAALVETPLMPEELLSFIKSIEDGMGRKKAIEKGPRLIDIDIILWENGLYDSEKLSIPHKSWEKRLFVIKPLLEIEKKVSVFSSYITKEIENFSDREQIVKRVGE